MLRFRSEHLSPPLSFSQCDSGYSISYSSLYGWLTSSPLRICETFITDPKTMEIKSAHEPSLRDRDNSYMTSHLSETDSDVIGCLFLRRYSSHCSQSLIHETFISSHPSERETRSLQECPAPSLHLHESDNKSPAPDTFVTHFSSKTCPKDHILSLPK